MKMIPGVNANFLPSRAIPSDLLKKCGDFISHSGTF